MSEHRRVNRQHCSIGLRGCICHTVPHTLQKITNANALHIKLSCDEKTFKDLCKKPCYKMHLIFKTMSNKNRLVSDNEKRHFREHIGKVKGWCFILRKCISFGQNRVKSLYNANGNVKSGDKMRHWMLGICWSLVSAVYMAAEYYCKLRSPR